MKYLPVAALLNLLNFAMRYFKEFELLYGNFFISKEPAHTLNPILHREGKGKLHIEKMLLQLIDKIIEIILIKLTSKDLSWHINLKKCVYLSNTSFKVNFKFYNYLCWKIREQMKNVLHVYTILSINE